MYVYIYIYIYMYICIVSYRPLRQLWPRPRAGRPAARSPRPPRSPRCRGRRRLPRPLGSRSIQRSSSTSGAAVPPRCSADARRTMKEVRQPRIIKITETTNSSHDHNLNIGAHRELRRRSEVRRRGPQLMFIHIHK